LKKKLQSLSFSADIPNSPESRSFATQKESTDVPSGRESRLDTDYNNNLDHSQPAADNTLGNKQQEALPKRVAGQQKLRNGPGARLRPIRSKEKWSTGSS
jgi:hypothetical protein